ncbi:MAG: GDSL-type esterase/lipase family protein [Micavibrio sp.]|nr:GDSL-type esterase/lipase family protein [Micavibrio sp.]
MNKSSTRRNFIKNAAIGSLASLALPEIVSAAIAENGTKKINIDKNDIILFQGDSITDWGRDHNKNIPNDTGTLGTGYVLITTAQLLLKYPANNLLIYNKGIWHKVYQLAERWDTDALNIKPTILSIHIGVNDFWHTLTNGYTGTIENYITDYHALLDRTKKALPNVKLVICEPFAVKGVKAADDKWYPTFNLFRKSGKRYC